MLTTDIPVLLLTGRASRALEAEALASAAAILCSTGDPSQSCRDCRRTARREHPDLLVAAPERRRRVNCPPFDESADSKETTVPAGLVRAVVGHASLLPYEAPRRAVVLLDIDRTDPAAFSALLKILEEPPGRTRFLLTAVRPRVLPSTILSRVVVRRLSTFSRAQVAAALIREGIPPDQASARAAFTADLDLARELDLDMARTERDGLLEAFTAVNITRSAGWGLVLAQRLAGDDATEAARRLMLLAELLRDAVAARSDPAGRNVLHRERFTDLERLGATPAWDLLETATAALQLSADLPESRRNVRLACEGFALDLVARS